MSTYLIDYENTNISGLKGIEYLGSNDQIIIFYGQNAGSIPFNFHVQMHKSKAVLDYIKTDKIGKNYLDFQLATYLGYLIATTKETTYFIISKDNGYESLIDFWKKKKSHLKIKRQATIEENFKTPVTLASKTQPSPVASPSPLPGGTIQTKEQPFAATTSEPLRPKSLHVAKTTSGNKTLRKRTIPLKQKKATLSENNSAALLAETKTNIHTPIAPTDEPSLTVTVAKEVLSAPSSPSTAPSTDEQTTSRELSQTPKVPDTSPNKEKSLAHNKLSESYRKKIRTKIKGENLKGGSYNSIYNLFLRANNKQNLNIGLVKTFQQEKGNRLYKLLLPEFETYLLSNSSS